MKPTIYDVARKAGVSIATVSKVVNHTGRIGEKTKKRVLEVMKELNYYPSVVASALTGKNTYTIGLLVPDIANPFFAEIARRVEDRGHELGFNVVMCSTDHNEEKEAQYISLLKRKSVDGIILASVIQNVEILKALIAENLPVALISRDMPELAVDTVLVDDFIGGYTATSHLVKQGHQRIAVLAENLGLASSRERVHGYRKALEEASLIHDEDLVLVSDFSVEAGRSLTGELLDLPDRPTAVFACNDLLAIGAIQAARERNLKIPDDLSVVGFDNTILATTTDPPLTTVAQPIQEMGRKVMDLLIEEIEGKSRTKQRVVLMPELAVRQSTKSPLIKEGL
ncbi:MAG TPA: LacI family DNA-binding transcriptional regulator [Bacillales bacterium]